MLQTTVRSSQYPSSPPQKAPWNKILQSLKNMDGGSYLAGEVFHTIFEGFAKGMFHAESLHTYLSKDKQPKIGKIGQQRIEKKPNIPF